VSRDDTGDGDEDGGEDGADDRLDVLADCLALKDERRTGWQLRGVADPESVAAHSWGVSLLCLVFADEAGVDADEALRQAVVHDLAEARTGDRPTRVDAADEPVSDAEKHRQERAVMAEFGAALPDVEKSWTTYERRETETSRFVKDMDLVDMCLQALVYERERRYDPDGAFESESEGGYDRLDEFFATAEPRLSTDVGRALFERIRTRYRRVRDGADHEREGSDESESTEL
jgi:putative hydrolase of HD superfamily